MTNLWKFWNKHNSANIKQIRIQKDMTCLVQYGVIFKSDLTYEWALQQAVPQASPDGIGRTR